MDNMTTPSAIETVETVEQRIARLQLLDINAQRLQTLTVAHPVVDDATFTRLSNACRCVSGSSIVLPPHHYETLSRGRGWARLGRGQDAVWGERVEGGYRVGPGRWEIGGDDGYSRRRSDTWQVDAVRVGEMVWTIAN